MPTILFEKSSCPYCRKLIVPTESINLNIPTKKRLRNVDCLNYEMWGMKDEPIMSLFNFDSYPTLFIGGKKVTKFLSKEQYKSLLEGFFEKDLIIQGDKTYEKMKSKAYKED